MHPINIALLAAFALLNGAAFVTYGVDKRRARKGQSDRRVAESTLLLFAAMGGFLGSWAAVRLFRHKVSKKRFLIPLALASGLAILAWYGILQLFWQSS